MCADRTRKFSGRARRKVAVENRSKRAVPNVRAFRAEDVDIVMAIVEESLVAAIWSKESYLKFAEEDGSLALVTETDGEISGFLIGRRVEDQAEILNLAVGTKHRRKRAGTTLLAAARAEFGLRAVKNVYLEVRQSNIGAIAFYEKNGFAKTGRRNGYYRDPVEAAIIMEKKLTG
jgi:ribosomal-protein-alanine N-acetyltransferase